MAQAFAQSGANSSPALVSVVTHHYDNARTGQNTNETVLTPGNVNTNNFGLLFSYPVDGHVYAQPLYVAGVAIKGSTHNLVFVATEHNSIYAFDADGGGLIWSNNMGTPAGQNFHGFIGIDDSVGITGTPVIDLNSGTLYLDAFTVDSWYHHRIHALNIVDGTERSGSPVEVAASVPGTGDGSVAGVVTFDPSQQLQRPALALAGGVLYVCYGSYADADPYHGWVIGFDASTLQRRFVFNTTPNGGKGAIWQSGAGLAVDANTNLYFETANGTFDADAGGSEYGDSFVKLSTIGGLSVADYFAPFDQAWLADSDTDLGSSGPLLLPDSAGTAAHPHLMIGCGKEGTIYVLDRDNLGHYNSSNDNQTIQELPAAIGGAYSSPAYFNNLVYFQGYNDALKSFQITNGLLSPTPVSQSVSICGYPPATPAISANGTNNAIAWIIEADGYYTGGPAILHAYDAYDLTQELYNSYVAGTRDSIGAPMKFSVPTVANGKVYVAAQYVLSVFGNLTVAPQIAPSGGVFTNSVIVTLSDPTPGAFIFYTLDNSTPTTNSILYAGPFAISNSLTVIAKAFSPGAVDSSVTSATFLSSTAIGQGIGLMGSYYSNQPKTFNDPPSLVRIDPAISFDWGESYPDPNIAQPGYSVRWTGSLLPQFSQTYTFYTATSDGVRLWVNDQLLIDEWLDEPPTEWSGSLPLVAGQRYNLEMDYYENQGAAVASLSWASPSTAKAIIPQSQLYPSNQPPPSLSFLGPTNGAIFLPTDGIPLSADTAEDGGTILSVDFFANGTELASISNSPYALSVFGLPVGNYALTARATDAAGITTTSSVVNIFVVSAPSPAHLAVSPGQLNFGFNALGSAAQASFVLTNLGTAPIINGSAALDGGPFTILWGTPFSLGGFASTNIAVQFSSVNPGAFSNSLIITTDNAGSSTNTVTGFATIPPAASFSGTPTSGAAPLIVAFTDSSSGDITNHFWDFGDGATTNIVGTNITHFYATAATNTVTLTASGPVGTSTQKLAGYIVVTNPPPLLLLSPTNLGFGSVIIGQTNSLSFQVINPGGQPLAGKATVAAPFSISGGSPFNLDAGQTGLVSVAFCPNDGLTYSNVITFISNGGNSTNAVVGSGVTAAQLAVSPALLSFGFIAVGSTEQASLLITNVGGAAMNNGVATIDQGPFAIVSGTPFNLEGYRSTNIFVQFSPGNEGAFSNCLVIITDNGGVSTNTVIGSAAVPPTANFIGSPTSGAAPLAIAFTDNSTGTITNRFWDFGDGFTTNVLSTSVAHTYNVAGTSTVALTVSGPLGRRLQTLGNYVVVTNPPALLVVGPTNLSFGAVIIGQTNVLSLQIINIGGQPLTGVATTAVPFSVSAGSPFNLDAGQTGLVSVAFNPSDSLSYSNEITFISNGGNSTNALTGFGLTPAQLSVSPALLSFGFIAVDSTAQASLLVTNLGGAAMNNGFAMVDNGPFTIVSGTPFNLDGFGSTNIVVQFGPASEGAFSNYLVITTDNSGSSTNLVSGSAAVPPIARFVANPTSGAAPLGVAFTDNSTGTITNRLWDWGDGATSNTLATTIIHTYILPETNTVALTVVGPLGTDVLSLDGYIIVTNLGPVTLTISYSSNEVQLLWSSGTLQSANAATGPYIDLINAVSPYTVPISSRSHFFRVRVR